MIIPLTSLSIVFLKVVYARYEVTTALPIEYGTLHFWQIMAGLLFFEEYRAMSPIQYVICFLGLTVVLIGVGLSSSSCTGEAPASPSTGEKGNTQTVATDET